MTFVLGNDLACCSRADRWTDTVGPHLGLLNHYFPGYEVTVLGSFIGFFMERSPAQWLVGLSLLSITPSLKRG